MSKAKAKSQPAGWFEKILNRPYQIIILVCALLYVQVLAFGLVHFDDHGFVLMAADTLKLSNIPEFFRHSVFWVLGDTTQDTDVFYRPLQNVVYAICNTIAYKQAWIYHFFGWMLHAAVSCMVFRLFKELKYHNSVAFMFSLIYATHPILVQGVAWIAGMGDQLAALFSLLSLIYFVKLLSGERSHAKYFFMHLVAFACALFSKEVSVMLIPLFLLWYWLNKSIDRKKWLFNSAGAWAVLAAVYFACRSAAIYSVKTNLLVTAIGSFKVNGPLLFEYFEKIFLPYRLSPIPSREDAQLWIGLVVFAAFISLFIFKKRFTRMAIFGAGWFVVFLFPTFIQQNPEAHFFAFEHRLYLPLIGLVIMLMEFFDMKQLEFKTAVQRLSFIVVLVLFVSVTFSHSRTFKDPYTFYDKALASSPKSVIAYNGYGKLLLEDKKYVEAIGAFRKSFEFKNDDLQTTGKIADIYLKNLNNPQEAIVWFKKTLEIAPNSIEAAVSIGDAYWNYLHDTANAITWYQNSMKIDPKNEFASAALGAIYVRQGKSEEARNYLSVSLSSNPENLVALKWMAISYFNQGKIQEALNYLKKGYEFYPADPDFHRNLMICYYKLNDRSQTQKFASLVSGAGGAVPDEIQAYLKGLN